jgi:hypothetical protein
VGNGSRIWARNQASLEVGSKQCQPCMYPRAEQKERKATHDKKRLDSRVAEPLSVINALRALLAYHLPTLAATLQRFPLDAGTDRFSLDSPEAEESEGEYAGGGRVVVCARYKYSAVYAAVVRQRGEASVYPVQRMFVSFCFPRSVAPLQRSAGWSCICGATCIPSSNYGNIAILARAKAMAPYAIAMWEPGLLPLGQRGMLFVRPATRGNHESPPTGARPVSWS